MGTLREVVRRVTADGRITYDEHFELLKAIDEGKHRASEDTRMLLDLWAHARVVDEREFNEPPSIANAVTQDRVEIGDVTWMQLRQKMQRIGYEIPYWIPDTDADAIIAHAVKNNVSEPDAELERLSSAAGKTNAEVSVAVLDSGTDQTHDALEGKLWTNDGEVPNDGVDNDGNGLRDDVHGWDFQDGDADFKEHSHGTHTAGLLTAGTARINVIPLRAYSYVDDAPVPKDLDGRKVAAAIDYAAKNGARVVSMSFAIDAKDVGDLAPVLEAVKRHPDVLFVKSAGNGGDNHPNGPRPGAKGDLNTLDSANDLAKQLLPNLAVISAADELGHVAEYTNFGPPYATHAARGSDVLSLENDNAFDERSGTSMATPTVGNAAAKMLLLDAALTPADLKAMLADTSDTSDEWKAAVASGGTINADRAMRLAALTGLIRGGAKPADAAAKLGLEGAERTRLLQLAEKHAGRR